ncbi:DnaB-like helicase N-terminal domain-containing protein [Streptomyces reniochalinae]|uniref:Helicase DnaB n=1 Tax=Streptomyces reniochalinae TaxID=2250578 RepID=A0A367EBF9_9ACTN|nr:DnaB-like helicase N-terminal domain-containing protein [Streptomyces reniochalinae]RCG15072.1 helicase DnaB [Streptomyces reniochalinae]
MPQRTVPPSRPSPQSWDRPPEEAEPSAPFSAPPCDLEAERSVLGACMHAREAWDEIQQHLEAADFYRPAHETVWRALSHQHHNGDPADPIALIDALRTSGDLERVGGPAYVQSLATLSHAGGSSAYYAQIVRRMADRRALQAAALRAAQQATDPGVEPERVRTELETSVRDGRERANAAGGSRLARYATDGWSFITDTGADTEPLWGTREQTAWAEGESLMLVGPPGVGKTSLAHQLLLARLGVYAAVLDLPVAESRRALYLALDRPPQIARALAQGLGPADEPKLRDRLAVWSGPLPATLDKEPHLLAELAAAHRADTVVIDSLKDAVSKLTDDEAAIAYNNARQHALREGVQLLELHHQRKATAEAPRGQRPVLDRVYGSTWFTSGAGSVLFIAGEAGDPAITVHQLKTVTGEIGPLPVIHNHDRGTSYVEQSLDPVTLLRSATDGLTARELATALTGEATPARGDVERARRRLERLVKSGLATKTEGAAGGSGGGNQARYRPSARHLTAAS